MGGGEQTHLNSDGVDAAASAGSGMAITVSGDVVMGGEAARLPSTQHIGYASLLPRLFFDSVLRPLDLPCTVLAAAAASRAALRSNDLALASRMGLLAGRWLLPGGLKVASAAGAAAASAARCFATRRSKDTLLRGLRPCSFPEGTPSRAFGAVLLRRPSSTHIFSQSTSKSIAP